MASLALGTVDRALEYGRRAQGRLAQIMEENKKMIDKVTALVEVQAAVGLQGWLAGRYGTNGEWDLVGVPVDLATGLALQGLAFSGFADGYEDHLHNLGNGSIAYYVARKAVAFGQKMKTDAAKTASTTPATIPATTTSGYFPNPVYAGSPQFSAMGIGAALSPDEIAAMAQMARR